MNFPLFYVVFCLFADVITSTRKIGSLLTGALKSVGRSSSDDGSTINADELASEFSRLRHLCTSALAMTNLNDALDMERQVDDEMQQVHAAIELAASKITVGGVFLLVSCAHTCIFFRNS